MTGLADSLEPSLVSSKISSHLFRDAQFESRVQDLFSGWRKEEEEILLLTNDSSRLSANPAILLFRCPNLRPLLAQNRFSLSGKPVWEAPSISVDFGAREVAALLTLLEEGETNFQNQEMFEGMVDLARALGVNIKDADMSRCNGEKDAFSILLVNTENVKDPEFEEESMTPPKPKKLSVRKQNNAMKLSKGDDPQANNNIGWLECLSCPKVFKSKSKLKFHAMCHPSFTCNICMTSFRFSSLLNRHMVICQQKTDAPVYPPIEDMKTRYLNIIYNITPRLKKKRMGNLSFNQDFLSKESLLV